MISFRNLSVLNDHSENIKSEPRKNIKSEPRKNLSKKIDLSDVAELSTISRINNNLHLCSSIAANVKDIKLISLDYLDLFLQKRAKVSYNLFFK